MSYQDSISVPEAQSNGGQAHIPLHLSSKSSLKSSNSARAALLANGIKPSSDVNATTGASTEEITPRRSISSIRRFRYSTDDNVAEVEADYDRDYSEGYSYGLKEGRRKAKGKRSPQIRPVVSKDLRSMGTSRPIPEVGEDESTQPASTEGNRQDKGKGVSGQKAHTHSSMGSIIHDITESQEQHDVKRRNHLQDDLYTALENESEEEFSQNEGEDGASIKTTETFTLRERQDAINTTHPFGIRIWKPALYKKDRSVLRIAEGDVHSPPGKDVAWIVCVGNALWTLTFGLVLFLACVVASVSCFLLFWSASAQAYGKTLWSLARFLLFPFGRCVQLWQDENYIYEDEGEGRSYAEYQHWQRNDIERNKLFFGPTTTERRQSDSGTSTPEVSSPHNRSCSNSNSSSDSSPGVKRKRRLFGRGDWNIGRIAFYFWYYVLIMPLLYATSLICWLGVFSLPMAKVTFTISNHLRKHPLAMTYRPASALKNLSTAEYSSSILLCTYRAMGLKYYKYTVDGTNIFLINLMFPVLFVIIDHYVLTGFLHLQYFFTRQYFIFALALAAIVPLAYFIGQAVASISAQTSMGMGATINAFFSTIVEVFLYCVALDQGQGELVEGSIIGSIFAGVLLLPGLSMCAGAIRRKTQRYNPKSAGVSATMLLFAVLGAFSPTIFYYVYGTYELRCSPCDNTAQLGDECSKCFFYQLPLSVGPLYTDILRPFSTACAVLLFVSYVIGLWFTLRTHASSIWATPTHSELPSGHRVVVQMPPNTPLPISEVDGYNGDPPSEAKGENPVAVVEPIAYVQPVVKLVLADDPVDGGGHDAPNWSRTKSTVILLGATVLYAVIAEILVDNVDVVLEGTNIGAKFLGVTVFALVPNTTEFLNAISFAMNGNVSLSMEIGSAYALQVCLLQIPALVFYSLWMFPLGTYPPGQLHEFMFTLIFPRWDFFLVIFCVFLFSYIYAEGKSNYFKGSILMLSYVLAMMGFYFAGRTAEAGIMEGSSTYAMTTPTSLGLQFLQQPGYN